MFRIVIECEKSAGLLAKIAVAARSAGVEPDKQRSKEEDDKRIMHLDYLSADKQSIIVVHRALSKIAGVRSAKVYSPKNQSGVAADQALPDSIDGIVETISNAYPNIGDLVAKVRESVEDAGTIPDYMANIGTEVAKARHQKSLLPPISQDASVEEVLAGVVITDIQGLADAEYVTEGFETGLMISRSIFTVPSDGKQSNSLGTFGTLESEAHRCDFLRGYIEGVVNISLAYPDGKVEITEVRCRNEGHPYCLFDHSV